MVSEIYVRDRLWPVLTALFVLLGGAAGVDIAARQRDPRPLVISVDSGAASDSFGDDSDADGEPAPSDESAVSPEHKEARTRARRGELEAALGLFAEAVQRNPDAVALRADYGYWLLRANRPDQALSQLDEAERLAPSDPRVAFVRGAAKKKAKDPSGAEADYRRALAVKPAYALARIALGGLLVERKAFAEAETMVDPATQTGDNPDRARAYVVLARAQLGLGKRKQAALSFDKAIERAPSHAELWVAIANAWLDAASPDDVKRASALLNRAAQLAPDVAQVRGAIGRAWERAGDTAAAEAEFERALSIDPSLSYARRRLLRAALKRREYKRARVQLDTLLARAPEDPEHHFLAGLVAAREGKSEEAAQHYRDALARAGGTYPEAWLNIGLLEKSRGNFDAAIAAYGKAIEQRPKYVAAFNNLSLAYSAANRDAEAERPLRTALEIDPNYAAGWVNLGKLLSGAGRADDAIAALQRATQLRKDYPEASLNLGVALARAQRFDQAITAYRAVLEKHPNYVNAWHDLGIALDAIGKTDEARKAYDQALAIDSEHVPTQKKLAEMAARLGRNAEAQQVYEDVLDHDPSDRGVRLALAELARRAGDYAGCTRQVEVAIAVGPADDAANRLREQCRRSSSARP
ncbi:MAG TPA: tetratricopeptide repeat protein [Polyangiaceae bacterium]|jgi:tetratricopeptide (TPR) repeat protein|nr:tetratricopeptide repeat protein [Polyangiaceae bacterium]